MNTFFGQTYLKPKYFNAAFLHGLLSPANQDAQSGVRRLQMYQLQEESLKQDSEKLKADVKEIVLEQEQRQAAPQRTRKAKTRRPTVVAVERPPEIPRFKRRPIYENTESVNEGFPIWLAAVSQEINQWVTSYIPLWNEHQRIIISKQREAANDADIRLRLLLLAA